MNGSAVSDATEPTVLDVLLHNHPGCCPSWRYPSKKSAMANSTFGVFFHGLNRRSLTICFGEVCLFAVFLGRGNSSAKPSLDMLDVMQ